MSQSICEPSVTCAQSFISSLPSSVSCECSKCSFLLEEVGSKSVMLRFPVAWLGRGGIEGKGRGEGGGGGGGEWEEFTSPSPCSWFLNLNWSRICGSLLFVKHCCPLAGQRRELERPSRSHCDRSCFYRTGDLAELAPRNQVYNENIDGLRLNRRSYLRRKSRWTSLWMVMCSFI